MGVGIASACSRWLLDVSAVISTHMDPVKPKRPLPHAHTCSTERI